jgi:hypothetical protein
MLDSVWRSKFSESNFVSIYRSKSQFCVCDYVHLPFNTRAVAAICACAFWIGRLRRLRRYIVTRTHSQNGYTALMWAAWNGHADCAQLLLDAGVDKEAKCNVRCRSAASAVHLL